MQSPIFAGSRSVPVICQVLDILSDLGAGALDDELVQELPPEVIILAACGKEASLPNRYLRRMPVDLTRRREQAEIRKLDIPQQVLEIPHLVLVRPSRKGDGRYTDETDIVGLTSALQGLAEIKPEKKSRERNRMGRFRSLANGRAYLAG